ncbi:Complement C3 [Triplophysa tibetana]|uniref:Complement C3 n=1 Tax=Triplophysa tibetana TaxID=1572043 RepID=A0A5A9PJ13_9TELE|nr:Complement C3 [Triplophysa tibetana]
MAEVFFPDKGIKSGKYAIPALARYLFGNNVNGNALVVFGVMDDERKTSIPSSLQRISILDGEGQAKLTKTMILQTFSDINPLVGQSIYISVSVFTDSGSEIVEAHRRGIQIVTSPYTIRFKGTPQYFKPGMPFDVSVRNMDLLDNFNESCHMVDTNISYHSFRKVYVTDPEQMPVKNVDVEVNTGEVRGRTKGNGIAKFTVNSQEGTSTLEITARTNDPQLTDKEQAVMKITAQAYVTKDASKNYLHVGINAAELQIGDQIKVDLNTGRSTGATDQDYTYLIISKGQIIKVDRFKRRGQSLVTLSLPVTKDMVPSFRFVAYYHVGSDEVVSDSVWVDVKDTCMGTLTVQVNDPQPIYQPGGVFSLQITGDPGAKVGLVVVDKAVHVLNKNRFTQSKIWDVIEKHDTGCTAGSGRDSMGVFYDAGLMFESSTAGGTKTRTMQGCPTPSKRRRRSNDLQQVTTTLAGKYSGSLKKCCVDGMRDNKLGYTCERRAMYIEDEHECVQAFLHCCNDVLSQSNEVGEQEMILARSEDDDYYESFDEITSRTQFPDSWLWGEEVLPSCPPNIKSCWYFLASSRAAPSLSGGHGLCSARPGEGEGFPDSRTGRALAGETKRSSTIIVFQAVAEYRTQAKKQDFNLDIEVSVEGRKMNSRWTFTRSNNHVTRSEKVYTLYYALPEEKNSDCEMFDLSVQMTKERQASYPGAIETYLLTIETNLKNPDRDAALSVLDIGLLTGYKVDDNDLSQVSIFMDDNVINNLQLSKGKDKYIERYEKNVDLSERGSLMIFLNKMSNEVRERVAFRIHKMNEVGMLQPVGVTLYEYNSPGTLMSHSCCTCMCMRLFNTWFPSDDRCVKFYHPHKKDGALNQLCHEDLCHCAEVYKTRLESVDLSLHADIYNMTIEQVLKEGTDPAVEGHFRFFLAHPHCRDFLNLEEGKTYLIMGQTKPLPSIRGSLRYSLGEKTWIEYWPTRNESQSSEYKEPYIGMVMLAKQLFNIGCTTPGIWKVVTRHANTPQTTFTSDFEVKEYGETCVNKASMLCNMEITLKPKIEEGKGSADLTRDMITQTFPNILQLVGKSLFVSVSVLTVTGSEMVEAQKRGLQIVTSPYTIHFKRTPQFFKPGMPFDVTVYATNPDQTPAENVPVEVNPGGVRGQTKANGIAKVPVNSQRDSLTLQITAKTTDPQLQDVQQAVKTMTAQAYIPKSNSQNYLHVGIDAAEVQIGDHMKVNLYTGKSPGAKDQDYTYMIISRGQIIMVNSYKMTGQSLVTLSLPVTKDMVPSFRFVAYYHVGSDEVVSDSVWVDVKDTCMGTLSLEIKNKANTYSPGEGFSLKITGDPGAKVGLVMVDKAVNVLNKNRLTQSKIWDVIEKHDTGCTAGSGRDSMGVFYDAGLMFESSTAEGTKTKTNDKVNPDSEDIVSRTYLHESWLWDEVTVPQCKDKTCVLSKDIIYLKESITTWQILAISLSNTNGEDTKEQNLNLDVLLFVEGRSKPVRWGIRKDNVHVARSDKVRSHSDISRSEYTVTDVIILIRNEICVCVTQQFDLNKNFNVTAKGTGTAALSKVSDASVTCVRFQVFMFYYAKPVEKISDCKHFDLELKFERESSVSYPGAEESYKLIMDFFYKSETRDATMSILDVGLLTGFKVDERDLTELTMGRDRNIQKFEMNKELSERGSLILYVNKVSHTERDRITFRIHKVNNVGLLQPAAVIVYEYYSPDARCMKYYHPDKEDGALSRLCHGDVCHCAEVYKVTVEGVNLGKHADVYNMKVNDVLREVLPTFEVTLTPSRTFFYVDDERLTVDITAEYLIGKKVEGQAFVVFGVMDGDSKTSITASLQRVPISEGKGSADLTRDMITQTFPNILQLVGKSIFVSVSVLTETGSEMVEAQKRGLQIVTSPYTIHFKRTPQFFKPGMPFDVSVYVTNPDQTPAENVPVEVNPGGVRGQTKANGIAKVPVNSQGDSPSLQITAKTTDQRLQVEQQAVKTMTAQAYVSRSNSQNYLHVIVDDAELEIGDRMKVNLYTGKSPGAKDQDYTYMIISRGQIIMVNRYKTRGQSLVTLSLPVTKDMVPSFRFVAYYHVGSDEVASDSVWVDIKDTCTGALSLEIKNKANTYSPGEGFSLKITGDPGAKVGLVMVDKAVQVLNKNRLTQSKGDVYGKDGDASLTAFVLISMQESNEFCARSVHYLHDSMKWAVGYLEGKLHSLTNPYAVAMMSYAMANANKLNKDVLMKHSTKQEEATAYAVLALVKAKEYDTAGEAVHWLARQQSHYGGFGTTQATIMVFQAVAEYRTQVKKEKNFYLEVELFAEGISRPIRWTLRKDNMHVTRSHKVLTLYYAKPVDKISDCKHFELELKIERERAVSYPGAEESYKLTMDFFFKSETRDATMSILDVGLLTGFKVDERDLKELVTGKDRSIQKFEMNKELSERGSLILYLNKVSHKDRDRIVFRIHKVNRVGLLQPAAVTVYEYYSPDARCMKYYHPDKEDGAVSRLCHGDVCHCAEVYKVTVEGVNLGKHADVYNMKVNDVLREGIDKEVTGQVRTFLGHPNCRTSLGLLHGKSYLIMGKSTSREDYVLGEQTWIEYWPTIEESQTPEHRDRYADIQTLRSILLKQGCAVK